MTYTSWREQKGSEILSSMAKDNYASSLKKNLDMIVRYQEEKYRIKDIGK